MNDYFKAFIAFLLVAVAGMFAGRTAMIGLNASYRAFGVVGVLFPMVVVWAVLMTCISKR